MSKKGKEPRYTIGKMERQALLLRSGLRKFCSDMHLFREESQSTGRLREAVDNFLRAFQFA